MAHAEEHVWVERGQDPPEHVDLIDKKEEERGCMCDTKFSLLSDDAFSPVF